MKQKAIITGASGFLGLNLASSLISLGWEVLALNRQNNHDLVNLAKQGMENIIIDKNNVSSVVGIVKNYKPQVIFHLASTVLSEHELSDIKPLIESNIEFGTYLLEGLRFCESAKIINAGTFWQHHDGQFSEPVNLYASTKVAYQKIIDFYVEAYNIKAITLILYDNFGPNDNRNKLFSQLLKANRDGLSLDMTDGDQPINLVYIDDVVNAFIMAFDIIKRNHINDHKKYDVSSTEEYSLKDVINLFLKITDNKMKANWGGKPYRKREIFKISPIAPKLPNWSPYTLEEGIKKLLDRTVE